MRMLTFGKIRSLVPNIFIFGPILIASNHTLDKMTDFILHIQFLAECYHFSHYTGVIKMLIYKPNFKIPYGIIS